MEPKFDEFRKAVSKFKCNELTAKEYKGISGRYGSYAQRGGEKHMVRLRMAGGSVSKEKLKFIVDSIEKYNVNLVHFTTCQAIQFHNLKGEQACNLVEESYDNGIITIGGGGDFPRNVTASPLSGIEIGESFDVLPYSKAADDYLLTLVGNVKLPRKLKVGFSNSENNETHATFKDLGFLAKKNGKFDVYSAGGLGNNPKMGICVAKDAEPNDILYYIRAMVNAFVKNGNYENRARARTRYMQETLGEEGYLKAYIAELDASFKKGDLNISITPQFSKKKGTGTVDMKRIFPQKQDGLYYVSYHAFGGDPDPSKFKEIYDTIKDMRDVELRTSPDETVYIINCTAEEAIEIANITDDGAETLFESSISCVGSEICQQGLRDSHGLLMQLVEMSRRNDFADGILPRVNISGCPSSCATHQIGIIGLQGASARINGLSVPAFVMFLDGSHLAGKERFGDAIGKMKQDDIPTFLEDVGKTVMNADSNFRSWYTKNKEIFLDIANKYFVKD